MAYTTSSTGTASATSVLLDSHAGSSWFFPPEYTISFFEGSLPSVIADEMNRLYGNLFSSPEKFRAYGQLNRINTYVARADGRPAAIFIFRRERNKVHVLNEQVYIPQEEIERFSQYIFSKYGSVATIHFKTVDTQLRRFSYPYQRTYFTNDVVLALPDSMSEYQASLGKSTRDNIKRYLKLLKRDFPSSEFQVHQKNEGGDGIFRAIIDFNRERMSGKNKVSGINEAEAERLHALVKDCGMVCTLTINGRVCAGTICYQFGDNYFMRVIAHDSAYSDYRVGLLCCYLTICECISRGGKNYHFLWGREEYKYRFLGQHRNFDSLTIYRSRVHCLANAVPILKVSAKAGISKAKLWLLDPANKDNPIVVQAHRLIRRVKNAEKVRQSA